MLSFSFEQYLVIKDWWLLIMIIDYRIVIINLFLFKFLMQSRNIKSKIVKDTFELALYFNILL